MMPRGYFGIGIENGKTQCRKAVDKSHDLIYIPSTWSLNVATAGSIIMFDRLQKAA